MPMSSAKCVVIGLGLAIVTNMAAASEPVYRQAFDGAATDAALSSPALGWTAQAGSIKVTDRTGLAGVAVDGSEAGAGAYNIAFVRIAKHRPKQKYVLTFKARSGASAHNSGLGFATVGPDGKVKLLAAWTRSHKNWVFDARPITESIPGQRERIERVWPGGVDETVACKIVVDSGGHWVWGAVTGADGRVHRSRVYQLPVRHVGAIDALIMGQDRRPGSGPIDVDDIIVRAEPAPPIVGTSPADWQMPVCIIEYSWTSPDTTFLKHNVAEMEKRPLDGVCVRVADPRFPHGTILNGNGKGDAGWASFQNKRIDRAVIDAAIEDLKSTPLKTLRHNYLVMVTYLPDKQTMDWFDDAWWANIAHNSRMLAEVAKKGGCEGIMFDPEEYGCLLWGAPRLLKDPAYKDRTYEQLAAKARQRGREFIKALNDAYPGVRIFVLHAWEDVLSRVADDFERMADQGRTLTMPFLDGMLEASDDDTIIMDGIENGYYVEELEDFAVKVDRVRRYGPLISAVPRHFRKKVRTATGIWLDRNARWSPDKVEENFWSPERYGKAIANALSVNDGFIWIWCERPTFWLDSPTAKLAGGVTPATGVPGYANRDDIIKWIPRAYRQAIENARREAIARRVTPP